MAYTPYSEFAEMDFAGDDVLTTTVTLHEYRKLVMEAAYLKGYMTGVLNAIDELAENAGDGISLADCLESRVRELFDKTNDKEGNENA